MNEFVEKIRRCLERHDMISSGDHVIVGVSGGADSIALLHVLAKISLEQKFKISIAHLNHSARGEESDADAQFVADLAGKLRLEVFIEKQNVPQQRSQLKTSFQEAARIARLTFLKSILARCRAHKVALGHTADDQVETVLMNLLRGSGSKGLSGMQPVRDCFIRPLFDCSRGEVEQYLQDENIEFRTDSSNLKKDYLRNRIRLDLIPHLEKEYNKNIRQNILQSASILLDEDRFLNELAVECFDRVSSRSIGRDKLGLERVALSSQSPALRNRVIRIAIQKIKGDLRKVTAAHVQEVTQLFLQPKPDKRISLPDDMEAQCDRNKVWFYKILDVKGGEPIKREDLELKIPGESFMRSSQITFKTQVTEQVAPDFSVEGPVKATFDFDQTGDQIRVRYFQPGDRFLPLGMQGSKKLKKFLIDEKIPQEQRIHIPILTTITGDIIWVYGLRISHSYRVTSETKRVLIIEGLTNPVAK